jgi:hypothetical protein
VKRFIVLLALAGCSTTQSFDYIVPEGKPVLGVGGVIVTTPYTKLILSGNTSAIPSGQPGDGGSAADGGGK